MKKMTDYYVGDFETTVLEDVEQLETEVWSSALCPIPEDVEELEKLSPKSVLVHGSIDETFNWLREYSNDIVIYYHNLKFDGCFWYDFLLRNGFTNAFDEEKQEWIKTDQMEENTVKAMISAQGLWYSITFKVRKQGSNKNTIHTITLRDSLKLIPFSVAEIGKAFQTKYQKKEMEYVGNRYANCPITSEEMEYIQNDVLVMAEAMYRIFEQGMTKSTIGSCCVEDYKKKFDKQDWDAVYPNMKQFILPTGEDADDYVRYSYRGGWCYVNPKYKGVELEKGYTLDVNSLYPSMMHSTSNNVFPVGKPKYCEPEVFEEKEYDKKRNVYYYFIRFTCRFELKEGYLPTLQIHDNVMYKGTEYLTTSDVKNKDGVYTKEYIDRFGSVRQAKPCITLTCTDWDLFREHYNITELEVLDYLVFRAYPAKILFDDYINKHMATKKKEKGVKRTIAKLFLNNLYGKTATSDDSSFKVPHISEKYDSLKTTIVRENKKPIWYIPIGSAITSYARCFTIKTAQQNYDKFCYADTDSIHCVGSVEDVKGVTIDNSELCCWKLEQEWDNAIFVRPKTYIEKVNNRYDIKCAGMPNKCKDLIATLLGEHERDVYKDERSRAFLAYYKDKFTLSDFKPGLVVPGKLYPLTIHGGMLLTEDVFQMRDGSIL